MSDETLRLILEAKEELGPHLRELRDKLSDLSGKARLAAEAGQRLADKALDTVDEPATKRESDGTEITANVRRDTNGNARRGT